MQLLNSEWRPLWIVISRWLAWVGGGVAVVLAVIIGILALRGLPVSAAASFVAYLCLANLAFIVSGAVVVVGQDRLITQLRGEPRNRPPIKERFASEIIERLRGLNVTEKAALVRTSYIGQWVHWSGIVTSISASYP